MRPVLALSLLLSCATPHPHRLLNEPKPSLPASVIFAPDFPEEFQEQVRDAMAFWNKEAGREIFLLDASATCNTLIYFEYEDKAPADPAHPDSVKYATTGYKKDFSLISLFHPWLSANDAVRQSVVRHELGHAAGLDHFPDYWCLMYRTVQDSEEPKGLCKAEREEFLNLLDPRGN